MEGDHHGRWKEAQKWAPFVLTREGLVSKFRGHGRPEQKFFLANRGFSYLGIAIFVMDFVSFEKQ